MHSEISGNYDNDLHSVKLYVIAVTVFALYLHPLNVQIILVALFVFHFEISGNDDNDLHPLNIPLILVTLLVFHFEISGNDEGE